MKIVPFVLQTPQGTPVTVSALLDKGSIVTIVYADIAIKIGATGPIRGLRIHGTKGTYTPDTLSRQG